MLNIKLSIDFSTKKLARYKFIAYLCIVKIKQETTKQNGQT